MTVDVAGPRFYSAVDKDSERGTQKLLEKSVAPRGVWAKVRVFFLIM